MLASLSFADRLLLGFADPEASPHLPPGVDAGLLLALLDRAEAHGVLPIVLRKLHEHGEAGLPSTPELAESLSNGRQRLTIATGQAMLLHYHGERVMRALAAAGIPARIVKGPVFARRLYRHRADRPFTDIDILVPPQSLQGANRVIAACGFELGGDAAQSAALQEFKWLDGDNPNLMIELHGNLVHDAGMRRRLSLDFGQLREIDADGVDTPAALATIAIVHAAGGHKFHRLQLCVDVLQAVRALDSAEAEHRVLSAARATGSELELATVLNVTGRLFGEKRALDLAGRVGTSLGIRLAKRLITPRMVLDVNARGRRRSRLGRDAFRWIQRLARQRPAA